MNIFITGASGFLGRAVRARYEEMGVRVFSDEGSDIRNAEYIEDLTGNLRDYCVDKIIHLAAHVEIKLEPGPHGWPVPGKVNTERLYSTNVTGTANVVDACIRAGVNCLVFASSQTVYGFIPGRLTEDLPICPVEHYAVSKVAGEFVVNMARLQGIDVTTLRIPGIYAEERKQGVVWKMCRDAVRDGVIRVNPNIRLPISVIHRDDVVSAIVKDLPSECFNVSTPGPSSLPILACEIAELVEGCKIETTGPPQPEVNMDASKIRSMGWEPRPRRERLGAMIESIRRED